MMQGYRVMADEAADQLECLAAEPRVCSGWLRRFGARGSVHMRARFQPAPELTVVEPGCVACLLASAERGRAITMAGNLDTLMADLARSEPSLLAWQALDRAAKAFMTLPDEAAVACTRLLADRSIVGGESGTAGLAGCLLAAADPAACETFGINELSRVPVFNTEGAMDPILYEQLLGRPP